MTRRALASWARCAPIWSLVQIPVTTAATTALVSANRASLERLNTWVSAEYEINDSLEIYMDAIISDNESFGRYAPPAPLAQLSRATPK